MATTVVPWVISNGRGVEVRPGAASGATCRSRSTNDGPGSSPVEKNGARGFGHRRASLVWPFTTPAHALPAGDPPPEPAHRAFLLRGREDVVRDVARPHPDTVGQRLLTRAPDSSPYSPAFLDVDF